MSNARAFLRLGFGACLLSLFACAEGIEAPGTDLTSGSDPNTAGTGGMPASTFGGNVGTAGTGNVGQGGSLASAGGTSTAGSTSHGGTGGNATTSGGSSAGGAGGKASGTAGSGGGSAGTSSGTGGGTGALGCTHLQPGGVNGLQVQYRAEDAGATVAYVYFDIEVDNLDDNPVLLSDLHVRYYFVNDLTTPVTDFYAPQIKHANGTTENVGAGDLTATYTSTYVEVAFSSSQQLQKNENVSFKVHMHSDPNPGMHVQGSDYSFDASGTLAPSCKVTLYQQTALAWGTPPAQ